MCWDSLQTGNKIDVFAVTYYTTSNMNGFSLGYFDRTGAKRTVNEAHLTGGSCSAAGNAGLDTTVVEYCMEVIRNMANTLSPGDTIYQGHYVRKHVFMIGSTVAVQKYYDPVSQQEIEVTGDFDLYLVNCGDFDENDFTNMTLIGDLINVPNGSTVSINPPSGRIANIEIVCDVQTGGSVRLDFTYENVVVGSQVTSVTGNKQVYLTPYANYHFQNWEFQRIDQVDLTGVDQACECSYVLSYEYQKY